MRLDSNPLTGAMAASVLAGPICALLLCLGDTVHAIHHGPVSSGELVDIWRGLPLFFLQCTLFCFVGTLLPNVIGSIALGMLGTILPEARLWAAWPIAGGSAAFLVLFLLDGRTGPYDEYLCGAVIGAACAGMCRFFTRWEPT